MRHCRGDVPVLFFWVRERVPLSTMGKFTLREHLAGLRNNDQLLLMLVMSFLLINVFNIRGGGYMYFITYVLQGSTGYTSLFFTMVTFASIIGSVIVSPLTRRFDTVKIYYYTNLLLAALAVLMWFLPSGPAYQTLWLAVILGNGVILGFTLPLHFSLMAFADDYGEWKTRVRSSGMNFAFNLFFIKLAWASSAGIISLLFILSPTSLAWKTRPPVRLAGSRRWKHCCLRYSTCCWQGRSAFANSIIL